VPRRLIDPTVDRTDCLTECPCVPNAPVWAPLHFRADPQRIILPESVDKRVLAAAAEATARGLAHITLLGDPATVASEGKKLGLDLSGCNVINPAVRRAGPRRGSKGGLDPPDGIGRGMVRHGNGAAGMKVWGGGEGRSSGCKGAAAE
jgi:hypothetical protein